MDILFLIAMAVIVGWLAVPVVRGLGYNYGRFGRIPDLVIVVMGTVIVAAIMGATVLAENQVAIFGVGLVAALIIVGLLTLFSTAVTMNEQHETDETT